MKYVDYFTSDETCWDRSTYNKLLIMDGIEYKFPYYFSYENKDRYPSSIRFTVDNFTRSENYIWGDDRISFYYDELIHHSYEDKPERVRHEISKDSFLEHIKRQKEYDKTKGN